MPPETSYGSIPVTSSAGEEETLPLTADDTLEVQKQRWFSKGAWRSAWATFLVIGALVLVGVVLHSLQHREMVVPTTVSYYKCDPFQVSPVDHLGKVATVRHKDAAPSVIWGRRDGPLPTNSWYLNLVSHRAATQPDDATSVYTVPYIIDTAPPSHMAGLRVHWPVSQANDRNIQVVDDFKNSLSLGWTVTKTVNATYRVAGPLSPLGVSLQWGGGGNNNKGTMRQGMLSHIIRGMPYATLQYQGGALPTLYSYNGPGSKNIAIDDGSSTLECGVAENGKTVSVNREMKLHFINSDFTWILFFSQPVQVACRVSNRDEKLRDFQLDVKRYDTNKDGEPLTVRLALLNPCTTGKSDITLHCRERAQWKNLNAYEHLLRESVGVVPVNPQIHFSYPKPSDSATRNASIVSIDWGSKMTTSGESSSLIQFALPHHQASLNSSESITDHCTMTFHGKTCLVKGNTWDLVEDVGRPVSFTAPRPPEPDAIPALAKALSKDIHYQLSSNLLRGAADTYFSGKILARLGRVLMIASELKKLASGTSSLQDVKSLYDDVDDESLSLSMEATSAVELPSERLISEAVEQLKKGVEIWLSKKAEAPFVYDTSWSGLVNCGCRYVGKGAHGYCNNTYPDCPALVDINEDFGNGYYNDHHYHYGYHIYAASVVAHFDPSWGIDHYDSVLLYIRDFANPSRHDEYFPAFRQKDWFLGSSWASGIVSAENSPHGRNEESSSEAIAAYEAVALYGSVMVDAFGEMSTSSHDGVSAARLVRDAGQLLAASEIHATNRYWHVWSSNDHANTYPAEYKQPVVGMMYETMASFQTWFAPEAVVSYGIQLMPFTPIAERRDDPEWATILYPLYEKSCKEAGDYCVDNGWSILQAGLLATTGDRKAALKQALAIPDKVFESQGGCGNSLTNTIWYVATRKPFEGGGTNSTNIIGYEQ